jgi:superfamily II DNA or RNA helicase
MYKEFEYIKDNVEMTTYADFNTIKDKHYLYDAMFIDECHHLASDIQGANIVEISKEYVKHGKYVFGFTATPIVINNKKNIHTGSYFNEQVFGYDIMDAIERGLFNKIEYAVAIPDDIPVSNEYRIKYSIDGTKTILENILDERKDITRWLVYFSSIEDLDKNIPTLKKVMPDYKIFFMHSNNTESFNDEQLREFNNYNGKAMLLTVSMVLEGIHPKNVGGIILYRNITKYNTLLQVLGRVCDINNKIKPLCIDIPSAVNKVIYNTIKELADNNTSEENGNSSNERSIKSIIDVEASSYKYINFTTDILGSLFNEEREYRGIIWNSDRDLSIKLGKNNNYVYKCKYKGKSYEEIIDEVLDKIITYRGIAWGSNIELSRKLGKHENYVYACRSKGKSYEEIIDEVLDIKINSYRGITWSYDIELSKKLGKNKYYVCTNKSKGKSYEEIIDEVLDKERTYRGITWVDDRDLSRKLGKNKYYIHSHKSKKSYEEIIDEVLDSKINSYRGITWLNNKDLSIKLGKSESHVSKCILYKRKSYEEIIDEVLDSKINSYRDITWSSDRDLSKKLGKSIDYVYTHKRKGKSYEEIIDEVLDIKINSYRGITWSSDRDLSRKLGKNISYVYACRSKGKSYKEIIDYVLDQTQN